MGGVPLIGSYISAILSPVAHALAWAAGQLETGLDAMLGAVFHSVAKVLEWTFESYKAMAVALLHTAQWTAGRLDGVAGLRAMVQTLTKAWHGIEHGVKDLKKEEAHLSKRVRALEKTIGAGIGNDVRSSVKALERWEKAAKSQLAADERAITQTLPGELTQLENFIRAIPGTRYLDWAAGIVTAAVGLEIFNLFRCPSLLNSAKNRGCGLWNGLEDVLALFFDAVIFVDLCAILPEAVTAFGFVEQPLTDLISRAANATCAQIPADWAVPTVSTGPLPPPQTLGNTLAA